MTEKWSKYIDNGGLDSVFITGLSKAFDRIYHQLLIAKLNAYGVDTNSLYVLASHIEKGNKEQRWIVLKVVLITFLLAFHKVLYQVHYYLA